MTECSSSSRFSEPAPSSRRIRQYRSSRDSGTAMPPPAGAGRAGAGTRPYLPEGQRPLSSEPGGRYSNPIKADFPDGGFSGRCPPPPPLPRGWGGARASAHGILWRTEYVSKQSKTSAPCVALPHLPVPPGQCPVSGDGPEGAVVFSEHARRPPPPTLPRARPGGLTLDQLPLVPEELLTEQPVLVVTLDHEVLLPQQTPPAQAVGPQLRVLGLQLVGPAQQPQHLPLVLAAGLRGQQLLQLRGLLLGTGQTLLQPRLAETPGVQGRGPGLGSQVRSPLRAPLRGSNSGRHRVTDRARGRAAIACVYRVLYFLGPDAFAPGLWPSLEGLPFPGPARS